MRFAITPPTERSGAESRSSRKCHATEARVATRPSRRTSGWYRPEKTVAVAFDRNGLTTRPGRKKCAAVHGTSQRLNTSNVPTVTWAVLGGGAL
jgi:hypothetical protein